MASRFWIGGTGTWDAATTTHWSATTGPGTPGASVPSSADVVTFDANSGGGVVTVNTTVDVQSITCGAFTGTLDFSVNNNNVTLSAASGLNASGSGTRTLNLGNGTWSLASTISGTPLSFATTTGLTFNANSSVIVVSATSTATGGKTLSLGGLTFNAITLNANNGGMVSFSAATITTLTVNAPSVVLVQAGFTLTVINALIVNGSRTSQVAFFCNTQTGSPQISSANNGNFDWCAFRDMTFIGGGTFTATNSLDLGHNIGIAITPPTAGVQPVYQIGI